MTGSARRPALWLVLWLLGGFSSGAVAQGLPAAASPSPTPSPPAGETQLQGIADRRGEISQQLAALEEEAAAGEEDQRADLLRRVDRRLEELASALEERALSRDARHDAEQALKEHASEAVEGSPPYSISDLDRLLDRMDQATTRRDTLRQAVESGEQSERNAQALLEDRQQLEQRTRAALEAASDPQQAAELGQKLGVARLETEAAEAQHRLREVELENARLDLETQELALRRLRTAVEWVRKNLRPTPEDLQSVLASLEKEEFELEQRDEGSDARVASAETLWSRAQERLDAAPGPSPALQEMVKEKRLALEAAQRNESLVADQLDRIEQLRQLWRLRYRVLSDAVPVGELRSAEKDLSGRIDALERELRLQRARLEERQRELADVESRLTTVTDQQTARWLREERKLLEDLLALGREDLARLTRHRTVARRLLGEVRENAGEVPLWERIRTGFRQVADVWSYQLTVVEDRSITVGKVVMALLLILVGYFASRWASHALGHRVFPRLGLDQGASAAFQSLIFYLLLVVFFLWALRTVNIPLTVFTVLGGALAIGVGFGSQNIVNNFISGLIMMAERPIKVGDLIDVDGMYGKVERIGPRSTRIRSGNNTHVIVPNSNFLEKNVLNWTLSDDRMRTAVAVGVQYGSPTEEVERLLEEALEEEPKILKTPAPEVLFEDFGDNALLFRCYFWIRVHRPMDRSRAESALRFRIDRAFREAGIVIAFPQRDVHLDAAEPVPVRVVGREEGSTPTDGAEDPAR